MFFFVFSLMKCDNCVIFFILHKQTDVLAIQEHQIPLFVFREIFNSELVHFIQQLGNLAILDQRSVVSLTQ